MSERAISVLLVDDHALVRRALRRQLEDESDLQVVGEAGNVREAVKSARALHPDVIVMDFGLPKLTGVTATQQILEYAPRTAVLFLSMHSEPIYIRAAFDAGARGYLLKSADLNLAAAVRSVAAGEEVLDPELKLSPELYRHPIRPLSARKLEVLRLIAKGSSNKEIARELGIANGTAAVHRANIMQDLGVHKAAKITLYAMIRGLLDDKSSDSAEKRTRKKKKSE
jgi:DNA-binding NarL/FixJ family response regulator